MPGRVPGFTRRPLNLMLTTLLWGSLVTLTPTLRKFREGRSQCKDMELISGSIGIYTQICLTPKNMLLEHAVRLEKNRYLKVSHLVVSDSLETKDCRMPGFPVLHGLMEFAQTHIHWVGDAIQPFLPLLPPSPAFNSSQSQGLFQWVSSSRQVAKELELQLQHQSFQWIFRLDFL